MNGRDLSGISQKEFEKQQHILDVEKWLASERKGRDLCGTMTWCAYCVKAEQYPCAKAKLREQMEKAMDEIVDELVQKEMARSRGNRASDDRAEAEKENSAAMCEIAEDEIAAEDLARETEKSVPEGYEYVIRYRRTFKSKLIQSPRLQELYTGIKNAVLGLSGVRSRMCHASENFRVGEKKIAKLAAGSNKIWLYLALDPHECAERGFRVQDVSETRTHRETPARFKITGSRSLKKAKELLDMLAEAHSLANVGCIYTDFHYPYKTDEELAAEGLIKPYPALVKIKPKK